MSGARRLRTWQAAVCTALLTLVSATGAGEADVLDVRAVRAGDGSYRFDVTVRHADTGWEHYANTWEVLAPDGKVLATRVLYHPHVGEQPFTRSISGVRIGAGVSEVIVRAHDSVHGLGGRGVTLSLPR